MTLASNTSGVDDAGRRERFVLTASYLSRE